ncbi:hypothetical protein DUNSADRAFT_12049 [Dunaliella salina]|nr:hypothetical protein DUNSADRAFT_12049 [Dunaliella salina]|eukprot:KAF5832148.1 hypothetical protein DUNSADRAFT_12049 [Dunaliella salina]
MQSVCTQDVQIMYRRFGSLLFIMATNNLLLHADAVRRKLEAVYDGMLLLFGAELLAVDKPFQLDRLRKALRGCQALDYFLCEDVTLPSILLPGPQEVALPPEDVSELRRALGRASQTASTQQAALLSNGLYLVCTPGWRQLSPRESCLLQVIATHHQPEEDHFSITVHLNAGTSQPCELVASRVTEGVQLACICQHVPDLTALGSSIYSLLKPVESILRVPPNSRGPPNQQLASLSFDLALIVSHQAPRVILVPGNHNGDGPQSKAGEAGSQHPGKHKSSSPGRHVF